MKYCQMTSKFRLLPYKLGTESGKKLMDELGGLTIHPTRGSYRPRYNHAIINWGNSSAAFGSLFTDGSTSRAFNHPSAVAIAINKLACYDLWKLRNVNCPEWTGDLCVAQGWWSGSPYILRRTTPFGHGGAGITLLSRESDYTEPHCTQYGNVFYTKLYPTSAEYRVHVTRHGIIDIVQKKRRRGIEVNKFIRSHDNGWVFCHNDIIPPTDDVLEQSVQAVSVLDLDFGAVDVAVLHGSSKAIVFEVNTAPGLEGSTVLKYANYFRKLS